jgi:hypothetical protein
MFGVHRIYSPQATMVGFDNGAANIEPHAHSIGFCAEKGLKHAFRDRFRDSSTAILDLNAEHGWKNAGV